MSVLTAMKSSFSGVPDAPPDPILSLNAMFLEDKSPKKVNLGVGAYRTDESKSYILPVVHEVEKRLLDDPSMNHEYLGIDGLPAFTETSAKLILGENSPAIIEGRTVTVQSLSGTGAIRIGMEFLGRFYRSGAQVYIPDPSWPIHASIVPLAGLGAAQKYRYFNTETKGVDFEGMKADISNAPDGSVIVLHACAHNPTGADLTLAQWQELSSVMMAKSHFPFFDCAYQGFASGDLLKDRFAVELFGKLGVEMAIAQSYAKNMGLYGERVGALTFVVSDKSVGSKVLGQLKQIIRPMYSSPPAYGARIAAAILQDPELFAQWNNELKIMSGRIMDMRTQLVKALKDVGAPGEWDFIMKQIGMFSYTGLSAAQVDFMREKYHIYMTRNGRISMAGLTTSTVTYLAEAMNDAVRSES